MTNKAASNPEIYKSVVSLMLPEGVLDYFDLTSFTVVDDGGPSEEVVHLFLQEKDNRTEEQKASSVSNGFAGDRRIRDFPICGRRSTLHIFRRRWLDAGKKNFKVDLQGKAGAEFTGSRRTRQLALFLKVADGEESGGMDFHWPDFSD